MKCRAILKTTSHDSESVAKALSVDNVQLDDLKIETRMEGDFIETTVEAENAHTLLNTLDDIICCQMVAERAIKGDGDG